jgi:DNA (cytosine-5)-methyltransferase 1
MGYHRAGFDVFGVDLNPAALAVNPFPSRVSDALSLTERFYRQFDVIHASPPCQASTALTKGTNRASRAHLHADLIASTRHLLDAIGKPYVIENVQGAKVRRDLTLCGEMFGLGVIRHRYFELGGWSMPQPAHKPHRGRVQGWRHGQYFDGPYVAVYGDGGGKGTVEEWRTAMGIDWMNDRADLAEAIPPSFTEHIGAGLMAHLTEEAFVA